MMKEQETEAVIREGYRWDDLLEQEGTDLKNSISAYYSNWGIVLMKD